MTTTSPSLSQSKKHKTEHDNEEDDFERVKRYLLDCPLVPNDHPAIRAAVEGLEKEQKRRDRDLKLQAKFANKTTTSTSTQLQAAVSSLAPDSDVVLVNEETTNNQYLYHRPPSTNSNTNSTDDDSEMMEWQDVEAKKEQQLEDSSSFLGKQLVQLAIQDMASHQVQVSSPLAAIAVVLHACLRSELLGFACTGIPQQQPPSIGFAPSIRELPKTTFLPPQWEAQEDSSTSTNHQVVSLRYRKSTIGALVLSVTLDDDRNVSIQIIRNQEPHGESVEFPLEDHINLDSWNAAKKKTSTSSSGSGIGIAPALHYKALHQLVTNVLRTFDLGVIDSEQAAQEAQAQESSVVAPYVDTTVVYSKTTTTPTNGNHQNPLTSEIMPTLPTATSEPQQPWQHRGVPATIHQAFGRGFPNQNPYGDFGDDLTPAGLRADPLRNLGPGAGRMGGNMMGPNHPMFHTRGPNTNMPPGALGGGGPGSMQPRFDPFLPPGVDPDGLLDPDPDTRTPHQQQQRPRGARRYPGEPNPDHLPPPNGFGGDMFS